MAKKSIIEKIEKALAKRSPKILDKIIKTFSTDVYVRESTVEGFEDVYGISADAKTVDLDALPAAEKVLIVPANTDPFKWTGGGSYSDLEGGDLYILTTSKIKVGDVLTVIRDDKFTISYKVIGQEEVGQTTVVITKYEISSLH